MTRLQRRHLQLYLRFRAQPMTLTGLLWANRRLYVLLLLAFAAMAALVFSTSGANAAAFVGVAFAVVILRDIAWYRRSISIWPLLTELLHWDKIEKLAGSNEDGIAKSP